MNQQQIIEVKQIAEEFENVIEFMIVFLKFENDVLKNGQYLEIGKNAQRKFRFLHEFNLLTKEFDTKCVFDFKEKLDRFSYELKLNIFYISSYAGAIKNTIEIINGVMRENDSDLTYRAIR